MFSVLQTKFSAFSDRHPILCRVPYQVFMVTMFYGAFYGLFHADVWFETLNQLLENTGSGLAQKSYGESLVFSAPVVLAILWFVLFDKAFTEEKASIFSFFLLLIPLLMLMDGRLASSFSVQGTEIFTQLTNIIGFILFGFFIAVFSRQNWNMAKKTSGVDKVTFYFLSGVFPFMYLLILAHLIIQKIF